MGWKMIFAADIVPTETNEQYFINGDVQHLFGDELLDYMAGVDFRCFNLEVPFTEKRVKVYYPGPHMIAKPATMAGIQAINPSLVTIGNNHVLDQGQAGAKSTIQTLKKNQIPFTGAGRNSEEARRPYFIDNGQCKVGIYNCAEYECVAATDDRYGANHYDPLVSFDDVKRAKEECDVLVVLYHGGKEFYRYPSPNLQRICRKFADQGANLVICQHTHCVGCEEIYKDARIVYGQGNFLFDQNEDEFKKTGIFVECDIEGGKIVLVKYVPFVKKGECVRMAGEKEAADILEGMKTRSDEIVKPGFIKEEYDKLAERYYAGYVRKLAANHFWLRVMNKLTRGNYLKKYYDRKQALSVINILSTENHDELLKAGLRLRDK